MLVELLVHIVLLPSQIPMVAIQYFLLFPQVVEVGVLLEMVTQVVMVVQVVALGTVVQQVWAILVLILQ